MSDVFFAEITFSLFSNVEMILGVGANLANLSERVSDF